MDTSAPLATHDQPDCVRAVVPKQNLDPRIEGVDDESIRRLLGGMTSAARSPARGERLKTTETVDRTRTSTMLHRATSPMVLMNMFMLRYALLLCLRRLDFGDFVACPILHKFKFP